MFVNPNLGDPTACEIVGKTGQQEDEDPPSANIERMGLMCATHVQYHGPFSCKIRRAPGPAFCCAGDWELDRRAVEKRQNTVLPMQLRTGGHH